MNKISDQAMLVSFSISHYTFRKLEKRASSVVEEKFHAKEGIVRSTKSMIAKRHLANIIKCVGDARTYHYKMTSDYPVKGYSILSCKLFPEYMAEMNKFITRFNSLVEEFIEVYPDAKEEAREDQGTLYDELEYPMVSELYRRFHMGVRFAPIPEGTALHVSLDDADLQKMKDDIEADVHDSMKEAMSDLWGRLYKALSAIQERMTPDGDKAKTFRDSLIDNLKELVQLLPKMNFAGDPDLDAMAEEIEKDLAVYDPEELRTVPENRVDALNKAEGYMKRIEPFVKKSEVVKDTKVEKIKALASEVKPDVKPDIPLAVPDVVLDVVPDAPVVKAPEQVVEKKEPVKSPEPEEDNEFIKKLKAKGIL